MALKQCLWTPNPLNPYDRDLQPTYSLHCSSFLGGYLIGSLMYNWLNPKKELQWRLSVNPKPFKPPPLQELRGFRASLGLMFLQIGDRVGVYGEGLGKILELIETISP